MLITSNDNERDIESYKKSLQIIKLKTHKAK